jgi:hypothetical protein
MRPNDVQAGLESEQRGNFEKIIASEGAREIPLHVSRRGTMPVRQSNSAHRIESAPELAPERTEGGNVVLFASIDKICQLLECAQEEGRTSNALAEWILTVTFSVSGGMVTSIRRRES